MTKTPMFTVPQYEQEKTASTLDTLFNELDILPQLRHWARLIVHIACLLGSLPVLVLARDNECLLFAIIMTPVILMRVCLVA